MSCSRLERYEITAVISKQVSSLDDTERNNHSLRIVRRRESSSLHTVAIITPKEAEPTRIYSASHNRISSLEWDGRSMNKIGHRKMGHSSEATIAGMTWNPFFVMKASTCPEKLNFETCAQTKETEQLSTGRTVKNTQALTIHTDACGPFKQETFGCKLPFVTFTVTPLIFKLVKVIESRDELPLHCYHLFLWVERNTDQKGRTVHSHNVCDFT